MDNPSIAHAEEAARQLAELLAQLGAMLQEMYAQARKALEQDLMLASATDRARAVRSTLNYLRSQIQGQTHFAIRVADEAAGLQVKHDAELWGVHLNQLFLDREARTEAESAVDAETDRQIRLILALLLFGMNGEPNRNRAQVFGSGPRVGLFNPHGILLSAGYLAATVASQTVEMGARQIATEVPGIARIAVLGKNSDHTQTCLNVSGQVVGLDEEFTLTGKPRFADRMHSPPFHWNCYTRVGLIQIS